MSAPIPMRETALRVAQQSDNAAILALVNQCPMRADVSLLIERDPDFFALSRARGSGVTWVAQRDETILGCVTVSRRRVWIDGEVADAGFVGDLRIAPDHRNHGLAQRLLDAVATDEAALPPLPYFGATAAGNAAVDAVIRRFGAGRPMAAVADMTSWQLLPLWPPSIPRNIELGAAEERDTAELIDLLDASGRERNLAPVFDSGGLQDLLARSPGLTLSDFLVARRGGRLVAALGIWDAERVKKTRVISMTPGLRALSAVSQVVSSALPLPALPRPGDALRFRYVRHFAHAPTEAKALGALVRFAVANARDRSDHFLLFTHADGDTVEACVEGLPRASYRYRLVAASNIVGRDPLSHFRKGLTFYDDAALA
jgi:GNAT superfamily N-acetyltransferase